MSRLARPELRERRARRLIVGIGAAVLIVMLIAAAVAWPRLPGRAPAADIALPSSVVVDEPASADDAIWIEMNEAMAADDRAAFLAHAEGSGRRALARWWDNTKRIGWDLGAITPKWIADDGTAATLVLGAELPFAPAHARGSGHPDSGLRQVQGAYYSAQLSGTGADRRITSLTASSSPQVWDDGKLHVRRGEHTVVFGRADESALVDEVLPTAERAARRALSLVRELGGSAPIDGFVVAVTADERRLAHWQFGDGERWAMTVSAFARPMVPPDAHQPWLDPRIAVGTPRSSGTVIVLGPRSADDREQNLVHEFAHAMLNAAHPDLGASPPAAVTEGFARYAEWHSGLAAPTYTDPEVRSSIAEHGAEAFSTERLRGERSWIAYAAAGSYYAFIADSGGDVWQTAVQARTEPDGLIGFAHKNPKFSLDAWQAWMERQ